MTDFNFESGENYWDHYQNESKWGEKDWKIYLNKLEENITYFLSIYNKLKENPNHLDELALHMGWDHDDLSLTQDLNTLSNEELEPDADNESNPYTIHKHPVFIVTKALYKFLYFKWKNYITEINPSISPLTSIEFSRTLHKGELNVFLAIQSLDLGDYGLTICHLKNSLSELNKSLKIFESLNNNPQSCPSLDEMKIRIFDLRELWIRVINDCRYEFKSSSSNDS